MEYDYKKYCIRSGCISDSFEDLCCSALRTLYPEYTITDVGQWWYQEHKVDAVGLTNEGILIAGECKFQQSPLDYDAFSKLQTHVEELRWTPAEGGERKYEYALFSRSGFTPAVEEAAERRDDLRLFTGEKVVATLKS